MLDCEGVSLGRPGGKLCLVQLASLDAGIFVFDLLVCPDVIGAGLRALLDNTRVLKVVHDCKMDFVALRELDVTMAPVFGSQLAFSVLEASPRSFSLADVFCWLLLRGFLRTTFQDFQLAFLTASTFQPSLKGTLSSSFTGGDDAVGELTRYQVPSSEAKRTYGPYKRGAWVRDTRGRKRTKGSHPAFQPAEPQGHCTRSGRRHCT